MADSEGWSAARRAKRSRAAGGLRSRGQNRTVARAHELVGGLVPGHDATQVSAHGVDTEGLHLVVVGDDEVGGITLETLDEGAAAGALGLRDARDHVRG